ncbi:MAG: SRPBCC family protein [Longimicrobiales bacterium]
MDTRSETRVVKDVEREVEIAASPDAVWQALTDAHELTRWFPMDARVVPGVGGSITMQWQGEPPLHSRIEIWMPSHHLRMAGLGGLDDLVTDIFLEGRGGSTTLRLVTSGFGTDANWDNIIEGFQKGWDFELLGLKHYLERHRGADRVIARARLEIAEYEPAWNRLIQSGEWFPTDLRPGDHFSIRAGHVAIEGTVQVWSPPRQMVGVVNGWNDALTRVTLFCVDQIGSITAWLSAYDVPESEVRALERAWQASLVRILQE